MSKGGHNKKPTRLKILEGTFRKDRAVNEPRPAPIASKCPSWLPREGKRKWRELMPKLQRLGLLTELDGEELAALCQHWAIMVEAARDIKRRGILIPSAREDGTVVKNPALQVLRDNSAAFDRYASRFGLSPQDRSRIDLPQADEENDPLERLLRDSEKRARRSF